MTRELSRAACGPQRAVVYFECGAPLFLRETLKVVFFMMSHYSNAPAPLRDFMTYHESIRGHSPKTSNEYFYDLRLFFRFLKVTRSKSQLPDDWETVNIDDVDGAFLQAVTLGEVYAFLTYLSRERPSLSARTGVGLGAAARARKVAAIRSFFKYATVKAHWFEENPVLDLDSPRLKKALPRYLTEQESVALLTSVQGPFQERDFAILTLFLNCGLRISELFGLDMSDARGETLRVLGKGNKERVLYLNDACRLALDAYLAVRPAVLGEKALFLSRRKKRLTVQGIHFLVKKHIAMAGLDETKLSSHKLRHTAATLMLGNGVDVRTLQEVLGHDHLNTTQIYTHVESAELRSAARANPLSKIKPPETQT